VIFERNDAACSNDDGASSIFRSSSLASSVNSIETSLVADMTEDENRLVFENLWNITLGYQQIFMIYLCKKEE
jgi:hypothetical protein